MRHNPSRTATTIRGHVLRSFHVEMKFSTRNQELVPGTCSSIVLCNQEATVGKLQYMYSVCSFHLQTWQNRATGHFHYNKIRRTYFTFDTRKNEQRYVRIDTYHSILIPLTIRSSLKASGCITVHQLSRYLHVQNWNPTIY
jgi:hypothetical protein